MKKGFRGNNARKRSSKISTHKFGIQIPNYPYHASNLDKINNDKGWVDVQRNEVHSIH